MLKLLPYSDPRDFSSVSPYRFEIFLKCWKLINFIGCSRACFTSQIYRSHDNLYLSMKSEPLYAWLSCWLCLVVCRRIWREMYNYSDRPLWMCLDFHWDWLPLKGEAKMARPVLHCDIYCRFSCLFHPHYHHHRHYHQSSSNHQQSVYRPSSLRKTKAKTSLLSRGAARNPFCERRPALDQQTE